MNHMFLADIKQDLYLNFIKDDRYMWLLDGLKTTLIITAFAVVIGIIIGFFVAIVRSAHDKTGSFQNFKWALPCISDGNPRYTGNDPALNYEFCYFRLCEHE